MGIMLAPGEIHVWRLELKAAPSELVRYRQQLSPGEYQRAERYATELLRLRAIVARGAIRTLLGRYLDQPPASIRFDYNPFGKPRLSDSPPDSGLVFNMAHSGDRALLAVSRDVALGVDLEPWRPLKNLEGLAERCLAPSELRYWNALPEPERHRVFFDFWTAKEAFVKEVGRGLAWGLERCELSFGSPPRLVALPEGCGNPEDWSLWQLDIAANTSAALCVEAHAAVLRVFDFSH